MNKRKSAVETSTPKEGASTGDISNVKPPDVSPLLENLKLGASMDSCFSFAETSDGSWNLKDDVKHIADQICNESVESAGVKHEEKVSDNLPYKTLNI